MNTKLWFCIATGHELASFPWEYKTTIFYSLSRVRRLKNYTTRTCVDTYVSLLVEIMKSREVPYDWFQLHKQRNEICIFTVITSVTKELCNVERALVM